MGRMSRAEMDDMYGENLHEQEMEERARERRRGCPPWEERDIDYEPDEDEDTGEPEEDEDEDEDARDAMECANYFEPLGVPYARMSY